MRTVLSLILVFTFLTGYNQDPFPPHTSAQERIESFKTKKKLIDNSPVKNIEFKNIGPTVFSGRVTDLDVNPKDPTHFLVAYASGGLWKTHNNGTTFEPIFDHEMVMTIGDIAVDWENSTIYVGTGESNSSRSSYSGNGIYKSTDFGENWEHIGLEESHHISRILIDPANKDILHAAVLGHLYSKNNERGIYKSIDGGKSWKKTLFVDDQSGAIDLIADPNDPKRLFAAFWEKDRKAWNFTESGKGSGIYRSDDNGENWTKLSSDNSGFPTGEGTGRIGLAAGSHDGKTILYALLDNYNRRPKEEDKSPDLTSAKIKEMSNAEFMALDDKQLQKYLNSNGFPEKYSSTKVKSMLHEGAIQLNDVSDYNMDANRLLFDTPVVGAEVYRSDDLGKSWKKTHEGYLDNLYNSYGYYFGLIRVDPFDADRVIIAGVPILISEDGGKNWENINGQNVHADHHALWMSKNRSGHLVNGNDGGVNISYDYGKSWIKCNSPSVGQFYYINVDMAKPYNVYGGTQDNGVWVGSKNYYGGVRWHNTGQYPYKSIMGGDGMQVQIDNRDNNTVYTGFQFGNYFRLNKSTGQREYITPKHELGEEPYRWNWQTPILLSSHNQDILYMGAHRLLRSFDQGQNFEAISSDLTTGGRKGDVAYSTLTSIDESIFKFGIIYTGSDDGKVHVTQDGGSSWNDISNGLPSQLWVSRIQASKHIENRVYLSLNGYRWDDFNSYVYRSDDYGNTWQQIGLNLPVEPVNVIKEDPKNADLIYVGTDHAVYVSLDGGKTFEIFNKGLPAAPVHDLVIHPRDNELVIGTHGRSIYVADVSALQQLNDVKAESDLHLFAIDERRHNSRLGSIRNVYTDPFKSSIEFDVYSKNSGKAQLKIMADSETLVYEKEIALEEGLNYIDYDFRMLSKSVGGLEKYESEKMKDSGDEDSDFSIKKADDGNYYLPLLGQKYYEVLIQMEETQTTGKLKFK